MTAPECRCHWAGEAFHCPVHCGEPPVLPTSPSSTPYPKPARLLTGPVHAALDEAGSVLRRWVAWMWRGR